MAGAAADVIVNLLETINRIDNAPRETVSAMRMLYGASAHAGVSRSAIEREVANLARTLRIPVLRTKPATGGVLGESDSQTTNGAS